MVDGGLRAVITCVDPAQLSPEFLGRDCDACRATIALSPNDNYPLAASVALMNVLFRRERPQPWVKGVCGEKERSVVREVW
jgi:hypothetical protein